MNVSVVLFFLSPIMLNWLSRLCGSLGKQHQTLYRCQKRFIIDTSFKLKSFRVDCHLYDVSSFLSGRKRRGLIASYTSILGLVYSQYTSQKCRSIDPFLFNTYTTNVWTGFESHMEGIPMLHHIFPFSFSLFMTAVVLLKF